MNDEERIKELTDQRLIDKVSMVGAYQEYKMSQEETISLRKEWDSSRDAYESTDLQLAKLDGRLTICKPASKGTKTKSTKPVIMTMDQVRALAKRVGIELKED